ncbi:hypothetical protein [Prauserella rugosa]|uniref:Uncharacterized protein n=1 Tax=Prauserella rugosa TaxID=43354 RepID=A0A660CBW1_9PSEU|nr:hypothetical protein [Prauserella rugosa]TWH20806.1 hypothetical protein JD82_02655 [Prauserella rugosa]
MTDPNAWQTPQIREALAQLEEAEVGLDQRIAGAKELSRNTSQGGLSAEDIQQIEQHARSSAAPRELRELQQRIDRGDLSWNDISAGRFLDDPQVRAALEHGVDGMRAAYTMIQEGQDFDEIIEAGGPAVPGSASTPREDADDTDDTRDDPATNTSTGTNTGTGSTPEDRGPERDTRRPPRTSADTDEPDDDDYFGGSVFR